MASLLEQPSGAAAPRSFGRGVSAREVYRAMAECEGGYDSPDAVRALRGELHGAVGMAQADLGAGQEEVAAWAAAERDRFRSLAGQVQPSDLLVQRAVLGTAPLGLVSGAWLQWLCAPGNAHGEAPLAALALYASDVDAGTAGGSRGDAFLDVLRQLHLADHASPPARLVHDHRAWEYAFRLPAALLAMGRHPDEFRHEILGADLCLRTVGLLPPLAVLEVAGDVYPDWTALDPGRDRGAWCPGGLAQARTAVGLLLEHRGYADEERVAAGFAWARSLVVEWTGRLEAEVAALDPAREMARLLRRRAHEGAMYHHDFVLGGRPLSRWLAESSDDPRPLLDALASSQLIRPGDAASSALVTDLVSERGPMFRIFTGGDLAVMRWWIDALPTSGNVNATEPPAGPPTGFPTSVVAPSEAGQAPRSVREAYHLLQRRTVSPAVATWAEVYAREWLARTRSGLAPGERQLPERWEAGRLQPWLAHQHDLHAKEFETGTTAAVEPREALIESTVQTAPLTLIDGSWLRGYTDYQLASTEVGRLLFAIFWDELGNGRPELNHPRIYRELLEAMGVDLPPTGRREFADSPLLKDASFELPVYWLSIGLFPRILAPEIVGLNLAIELSGVGGSYRLAHRSLTHHGFDTQFVDLHNAIDNVLTGHSAWAAEAVEAFVAGIGDLQGPEAQQEAWARVRTGFSSLEVPLRQRRKPPTRRILRRRTPAAVAS
ncbi:MAG: iron-containing redox enzyme family protein [Acidimicrobiales bacterium]